MLEVFPNWKGFMRPRQVRYQTALHPDTILFGLFAVSGHLVKARNPTNPAKSGEIRPICPGVAPERHVPMFGRRSHGGGA